MRAKPQLLLLSVSRDKVVNVDYAPGLTNALQPPDHLLLDFVYEVDVPHQCVREKEMPAMAQVQPVRALLVGAHEHWHRAVLESLKHALAPRRVSLHVGGGDALLVQAGL